MAFDFPKNHWCDTFRGVQGGMNTTGSGSPPANHFYQNNVCIILAPSRYSNVQKVVFSMATGKFGAGTTSEMKLGMQMASTTVPPTLTPQQFTLGVTSILEGTSDFGFTPSNRVSFSKRSAQTTIVQSAVTTEERDHAQLVTLEYERGVDLDFFAAWDVFSAEDNYAMFLPFIESISADSSPIAFRFKTLQCTVVQKSDSPNNSCTHWHGFIGCNDLLESTTAFQGDPSGFRNPFHYFEDDWDGITKASIVFYGSHAGATSLTIRLFDITTSGVVFDEVFTVTNGTNYHIVRTQDFLSSLVDGREYVIDYLLNTPTGATDPRGTGFIELIQAGFSKTVCLHQMTGRFATPSVVDRTDANAILFDPTWYDGIVGGDIAKRKSMSSIIHRESANDPRQILRLDTNLLADDSARASGSAVDLTPEHTITGMPVPTEDLQFTDIVANDPIDLVGVRRLQKSYLSLSTWTGGIQEFPGHMGLYYALGVPGAAGLTQFGHRGDPDLSTNDIGPI